MAGTYSRAGDDAGLKKFSLDKIEDLRKAQLQQEQRKRQIVALRRGLIPALRKDRKGDWSTPIPADATEVLNTATNDGVAKFNNRFTTLYFTRCWAEPEKEKWLCYIKSQPDRKYTVGDAEKMMQIAGDSSTVIGHPTVSDDENTIYFSAELPGGHGGKDIWMTKRTGRGKGASYSHPETRRTFPGATDLARRPG